jgi:hypothetical protein
VRHTTISHCYAQPRTLLFESLVIRTNNKARMLWSTQQAPSTMGRSCSFTLVRFWRQPGFEALERVPRHGAHAVNPPQALQVPHGAAMRVECRAVEHVGVGQEPAQPMQTTVKEPSVDLHGGASKPEWSMRSSRHGVRSGH